MYRYKIETTEITRSTNVYSLYIKKGRWPFRHWEWVNNFPSKGLAEEHIQTLIKRPRIIDTNYYFEVGHEDNMW